MHQVVKKTVNVNCPIFLRLAAARLLPVHDLVRSPVALLSYVTSHSTVQYDNRLNSDGRVTVVLLNRRSKPGVYVCESIRTICTGCVTFQTYLHTHPLGIFVRV